VVSVPEAGLSRARGSAQLKSVIVGRAGFVKAFGAPNPSLKMGIHFAASPFDHMGKVGHGRRILRQRVSSSLRRGIESPHRCLFWVPPAKDRMILGYNAFGSILVLEKASSPKGRVDVLDPFRLDYSTNPDFDFFGFVGVWLPMRRFPHIFDNELYRCGWKRTTGFSRISSSRPRSPSRLAA
jgi:hypothetical protein